jgi:HEAT repeat protein
MKRAFAWGAVMLLVLAGWVKAEGVDAIRQEVKSLFREGVDLFQEGKYSESQLKFKQVIAMDPTEKEAEAMVKEAGDKAMFNMILNTKLGPEPQVIWDLYRRYSRRMKRDAELIKKLVAQAVDPAIPDKQRWDAVLQLGDIGQFAVPLLAEHLGNELDPDVRTYARLAITRLGSRAVLPTIELLSHENRLVRENAALILGDIEPSDPRGIAPLKAVFENAKELKTVKDSAGIALEKVTGRKPEQLLTSAEYYYRKAERYLLETAGVPAEAEMADGVVWHLKGSKQLVYIQVPYYTWNEIMSEQSCYDCFRVNPAFDSAISLFACAMAAQFAEVNELKDLAQERPGGQPLSQEEIDEVNARATRLKDAPLLVRSVGPDYLYKALDKALEDRQDRLAVVVIDAIRDVDPRGELLPASLSTTADTGKKKADASKEPVKGPVGESLIKALSYTGPGGENSGREVRYHAAIAIAHMNPDKPFPGSELVVSLLANAVGETGPAQIVLVEEDSGNRNALRARLAGIGYGVTLAADGRDGLGRATTFPPKDIIVISDSLKSNWDAKALIEQLKGDPRSRYIPIIMLADLANREEVRAKFPNVPVMHREDAPEELKRVTEETLAGQTTIAVTKRKAEEIAIMAAEALAVIDPYHTSLNTADSSKALTDALVGRADAVRMPVMTALGNFKIQAAFQPLINVFSDKSNTVEIRRKALWAVARVRPASAFTVFLNAEESETDFDIRYIASEGYGLGKPDYESIIRFVGAARVDKEQKEE